MQVALVALGGPIESLDAMKGILASYKHEGEWQYVLGVDKGCEYLHALNEVPDVLLGDFDSIDDKGKYRFLWPDAELLEYSSEKDQTDSEIALEWLSSKPIDHIVIIGGLGGRVDHMLANLHRLCHLPAGVKVSFIGHGNIVVFLQGPTQENLSVKQYPYQYISLIPLSQKVLKVDIEGVKYPLVNKTLNFGTTLGISNELKEDFAVIRFEKGKLLLINSSD